MRASRASTVGFQFYLHEEWLATSKLAATMRANTKTNLGDPNLGESQTRWGSSLRDSRRWNLVMHPDHPPHLVWSILSANVVGIDVLSLPLALIRDESFLPLPMHWAVAIWWGLDIIMQLITGYHVNGLIELRMARTAKRYARTGMVIDLPLVLFDFFILLAESLQHRSGVDVVRLSRSMRSLRLVRLVRIVRLYKVTRLLDKLIDRLPSATLVAAARMCNLIISVLLVSHYIACVWCGLARFLEGSHTTWLSEYDVDDDDATFKYALALHWALTQFMPAPTDVKPMNVHERSFAIAVVMFALIVFSSFVGSISSKITEIRQLRSREFLEEARVREYLGLKRVSLSTGLRIWHHLKTRKRADTNLQESDVVLLAGIPLSLRSAMRAEVHMPVLSVHGLFVTVSSVNLRPMVALCCFGMSEIACKSSQDLFLEGDTAHDMYFIVSGEFEYRTPLYLGTRIVKGGGDLSWVCEVALWGDWVHCGQMFASVTCHVTALNAKKFREVMTKTHVNGSIAKALKRYAAEFALLILPDEFWEPLVTDIIDDPERMTAIVTESFSGVAKGQSVGKAASSASSAGQKHFSGNFFKSLSSRLSSNSQDRSSTGTSISRLKMRLADFAAAWG